MKFFSRETSKKLAKMGCKSESEFFYCEDPTYANHSLLHPEEEMKRGSSFAFHESDFIGTSERSKENANIVAPEYNFWHKKKHEWSCDGCAEGCCDENDAWHFRHGMIDSEDSEQYLLETMKK